METPAGLLTTNLYLFRVRYDSLFPITLKSDVVHSDLFNPPAALIQSSTADSCPALLPPRIDPHCGTNAEFSLVSISVSR